MSTDPLKITGDDLAIIHETLRTGDLNIFTSRYMWLGRLCAGAMVAIGLLVWRWRSGASCRGTLRAGLSAYRLGGRLMEGPTGAPAQVAARS